jgi:Amt family ammonium transporter
MSVLWVIAGYSIAFGDGADMTPYWGGLSKLFLNGVGPDSMAGTIPETVFSGFQMTFAVITPALIIGAFVERIRFSFVLIFSSLWMLLCYAPVTHWVWGTGGFLLDLGTVDLAGGLVVHQTAGLAALVIAYFLGSRKDQNNPPHNPSYVMIGTCLLWVGWFGFNAGSQLAANGSAGMTLLVTHLSAAAASLSWAGYEYFKHGKASLVGLATGTIAGLATITPASGSVSPMEAILIGAFVGIVCQEMCSVVKNQFNIDDSLDVFAVHGVGGMIGVLSIAFFGYAGWYEQFFGIAVVGIYTIVITAVIILVAKSIVPIRVSGEEEESGLDLSEHGEKAYSPE